MGLNWGQVSGYGDGRIGCAQRNLCAGSKRSIVDKWKEQL